MPHLDGSTVAAVRHVCRECVFWGHYSKPGQVSLGSLCWAKSRSFSMHRLRTFSHTAKKKKTVLEGRQNYQEISLPQASYKQTTHLKTYVVTKWNSCMRYSLFLLLFSLSEIQKQKKCAQNSELDRNLLQADTSCKANTLTGSTMHTYTIKLYDLPA